METGVTAQDGKEKIWRITQEVLPSANLRRATNLLKTFRNMKCPDMGIREFAVKVIADAAEYKDFCEAYILRTNKLEDDDFRHILNETAKMNLEQIEILINHLLLAKTDILRLINKYK